jgi:hypothetical protein
VRQFEWLVCEHLKLTFELWVDRGSRALLTFFCFGSAGFGEDHEEITALKGFRCSAIVVDLHNHER